MFLHPLGLIALLAVPGVVALHLYRRRFAPRAVSGLFLWRVDDRVPLAGRKRERLINSTSFWCEVLAALFLALAFAGPRAACAPGRAEHLVVVLDSSASMEALVDGKATSARAREVVEQRVDALGRGSRVTIVRSGPRPALVAGPAAFTSEALERVAEWRALAARHDLQPAVALALEFAGGGKVLLVTDHYEPEAWPASVELISVGAPAANLALTHAARSREFDAQGKEIERVFVSVTSFAPSPQHIEVRASSAGRVIAKKSIDLEPAARAHLSFELAEGTGVVEIALPDDALALDNTALLAPPAARTLALFSTLEDDDARALGLSEPGAANIARWCALIPHSVVAGSADSAHLLLARGASGGAATWCLSIEGGAGSERRDYIGPFLAERANALLDGTTLEGVVWSVDPSVSLAGMPVVSAGNTPILSEEQQGERRLWQLALDPSRSSLQRSPDWPILLANMAELRRAELPGPQSTNLHTGESFIYRPGNELAGRASDEIARYTLEGPRGSAHATTREVPALGQIVVDGLEEPGLYALAFEGRTVAEFALSFADAAESDLAKSRPGHSEAELAGASLDTELSWIELALIALTLTLVALDWFVLRRAEGVLEPAN